jgi:hypothetical protein
LLFFCNEIVWREGDKGMKIKKERAKRVKDDDNK